MSEKLQLHMISVNYLRDLGVPGSVEAADREVETQEPTGHSVDEATVWCGNYMVEGVFMVPSTL